MSDRLATRQSWQSMITANLRNYSMVIMLAVIMVVFAVLTGGVNLNSRNISNIFMQNSHILLLAVGMVLVIITGNIDLSVPSTCAFIGAISAMIYNTGVGMVPTVAAALVLGGLIGAFQGSLIAFLKMPSFIVTLGGMLLFRGLTYIATNVTPVSLNDDGFKQISSGMMNLPGLSMTLGDGGRPVYLTAVLVGAVLFVVYAAGSLVSRRKKIKHQFPVSSTPTFLLKLVAMGVVIGALSWVFATYRGIPVVVVVLGITGTSTPSGATPGRPNFRGSIPSWSCSPCSSSWALLRGSRGSSSRAT